MGKVFLGKRRFIPKNNNNICEGGLINIKEPDMPPPPPLPSKIDKLNEIIKGIPKKRVTVPQNNIKFHFN